MDDHIKQWRTYFSRLFKTSCVLLIYNSGRKSSPLVRTATRLLYEKWKWKWKRRKDSLVIIRHLFSRKIMNTHQNVFSVQLCNHNSTTTVSKPTILCVVESVLLWAHHISHPPAHTSTYTITQPFFPDQTCSSILHLPHCSSHLLAHANSLTADTHACSSDKLSRMKAAHRRGLWDEFV